MKSLYTVIVLVAFAATAYGGLHSETLEYRQGENILEGYLVYNDQIKGPRPGVIVVHDWMGLGDFARKRADELAQIGYIALAADIYGKGVRPKESKEASALAGKYKSDVSLLRDRVLAALDVLGRHELTDRKRIAAIGYCFGGTTVLELARSGAEVSGVVSFHGGLATPKPAESKQIKAKVLVLHGADDPLVPPSEVIAFQEEMRKAGVDWQMVSYGNAVHSFTSPAAGNDPSKGVAYNEKADKRSWDVMKNFFGEMFK